MDSPTFAINFERDALDALSAYVEIPCLSPDFDAEWEEHGYLERAIAQVVDFAQRRAISDMTLEVHRLPGRTPVLLCEVAPKGASGTVLLYGHLDKQPPLGTWSEGLDPFVAVRRGDLLYGRGAADDGYAAFSALLAIEALQAAGANHGRLLVLIETSEESGSPDLDAHVEALADRIGTPDLVICLDAGGPTDDRLWMVQSLRGNVIVKVKVEVLTTGVHSGTASGVVPSSFRVLRQLLDRVEDATTGQILLPELTAQVPSDHLARIEALTAELGDALGEGLPTVEGLELQGSSPSDRLVRQAWTPTLSVIGIDGIPAVADGGNVLRASTTAKLSFRLPPSVDAERATAALLACLEADPPQGAKVTVTPDHPANGWACPPLEPWLEEAVDAASLVGFNHVAGWSSEGGSIPFLAQLGRRFPSVAFVATGALGPGSNAHGIDESLNLTVAQGVTVAVSHLLAHHAAAHA